MKKLALISIAAVLLIVSLIFFIISPQLGKALQQIKALGAEPERAVFSEGLMRDPVLELYVRRDDGIIFELYENITPGDALLIYAKNSRIISLVVVGRDMVDMLTESRVVPITEARKQLGS